MAGGLEDLRAPSGPQRQERPQEPCQLQPGHLGRRRECCLAPGTQPDLAAASVTPVLCEQVWPLGEKRAAAGVAEGAQQARGWLEVGRPCAALFGPAGRLLWAGPRHTALAKLLAGHLPLLGLSCLCTSNPAPAPQILQVRLHNTPHPHLSKGRLRLTSSRKPPCHSAFTISPPLSTARAPGCSCAPSALIAPRKLGCPQGEPGLGGRARGGGVSAFQGSGTPRGWTRPHPGLHTAQGSERRPQRGACQAHTHVHTCAGGLRCGSVSSPGAAQASGSLAQGGVWTPPSPLVSGGERV